MTIATVPPARVPFGIASSTSVADAGLAVWEAVREAQWAAERSVALFGPQAAIISEVRQLLRECNEPDWDGYGARPVAPAAAELAVALIRLLPPRFPLPEVAPEPDGSVSLDWIRSRHRLLSVSARPSGGLPYAWIDGSDRGYGVARFDGEAFPRSVLEAIARIMTSGGPSLRTS